MATNSGTPGDISIAVNVNLHDSRTGEKPPQAVAYAFTASGHFITRAAVDGNGDATLFVPAAESARDVRIVAGPEVAARERPALSELTRRGSRERFVRIEPEGIVAAVSFEIPAELWTCWIRFCFVQGKLLKRVLSGGLPVDLPVCNADVQIWEVEPIEIVIAKLPDFEIAKLRQVILDPSPSQRSPFPVDVRSRETAGPLVTFEERVSQASSALTDLQFAAQHADATEFRRALAADAAMSRIFICDLFPLYVTETLVATATTDRCGTFESLLLLSCYSPYPNLYFTATANFFGFPIDIYRPTPVACYTYWDYPCGTSVTLYTQSPFAPCCSPCAPVVAPENYVLFRAIGNVQLNAIFGTSTALAGSTNATNIGQFADGGGPGLNAPFGSFSGALPLLPRVEFDGSLRDNGLAMYYVLSYRFGTAGSFVPLLGQIDRHFNHFVGPDLVTSPYNLGPKPVNGLQLFEIPPSLPPAGDWAFPDPRYDLANAQFPSSDLPGPIAGGTHGKYQLKLDLFDSAGNPVDIAAAGIAYFVPTTVDPDGTIHTADASTLGLVSGNSFIMTLHIDNRPTFGALGTPTLDGNSVDGCGVFRYTGGAGSPAGVVTIPYTATHPDNFATYSYRLSRGATPLTPPTASGVVSAATNPATVAMSAKSLLTQPDAAICDVAGFAEDLYVAALATDGWSRLSEYDSSPPPLAFVLAPKS